MRDHVSVLFPAQRNVIFVLSLLHVYRLRHHSKKDQLTHLSVVKRVGLHFY